MIGLLAAVIVISVIFRIIDRVSYRVNEHRPNPDDVLAERYARGEITDEEYQHRRSVRHGDTMRSTEADFWVIPAEAGRGEHGGVETDSETGASRPA